MPVSQELTVRFTREHRVFENGPEDRTIIGHALLVSAPGSDDQVTIKGNAADGDLQSGMLYRMLGFWKEHPRFGSQFWFSSFAAEQPTDPESYVAYLKQCRGPLKGSITDRVAWELVEALGDGCIDTVISRPAEASKAIRLWSVEKAMLASAELKKFEGLRNIKIELIGLLDGRGFPKKTVDAAIRKFGSNASEQIRQDPYVLMSLRGCGFKLCDKMYCDLANQSSTSREDYLEKLAILRRQAMCAWYAVTQEITKTGSTWVREHVAFTGVRQNISGILIRVEDAVAHACAIGLLSHREHGGSWLSLPKSNEQESIISQCVTGLQTKQQMWPSVASMPQLSDHQRPQMAIALSKRVGILKGSPGTGKTFSVSVLVRCLLDEFGAKNVAVACPTGKAAVRATEALAENDVDLEATTIHTLLGVESGGDDGWTFFRNESNPTPERFLIIDETSMVDIPLMASLMRATGPDTHILFTGDAGQLAPVGHGTPFLDLQDVVPTGSLTEIRRNSGRIVQACAEIRDRNTFTPSIEYDESTGENLPWMECKGDEQQSRALHLVQTIEQGGECDPIWDLQVLVATNDESPVSRRVLNPEMQNLLNPHGERVGRNPFRVGDKIVCLSNGWYSAIDKDDPEANADGKMRIANGDLAEVLSIESMRMFVEVKSPIRRIVVPVTINDGKSDSSSRQRGAVGDWDLGFVLSVHKSQGSQWEYVILIVDSSGRAQRVQTRQWLFTGISRAKNATFGIGELQLARSACRRDGIAGRKTFLTEKCLADRFGGGNVAGRIFGGK